MNEGGLQKFSRNLKFRAGAMVWTLMAWTSVSGLLSGCAAMHETSEQQWQAMHAIDTIQTFHIASDSRYKEVESAWLIGEHPDNTKLLAWSVGTSMAHAAVTHLLIANDMPRLSKVWQYVTLSSLCNTVGHNAAIGIRIGGPNAGPDPTWRPKEFQLIRPYGPASR